MLKTECVRVLTRRSKALCQLINPSKEWIVTGNLLSKTPKALLVPRNDVCRSGCIKISQRNFAVWDKKKKDEEEITLKFREFEKTDVKNKQSFIEMVRIYEANFPNRTGHVDFLRIALKHMKEFGVHDDLEVYKKLFNVFPKGVFISSNKLLASAMYFPRQQYAVLEGLNQMETFGVCPDVELGDLLKDIFGKNAYVCRKYYRMLYWSVKFKNKTPWPIPMDLPSDLLLLGKLAVERIMSVDIQSEISVFQAEEVPDSIDKTWIVSGQSPTQKELLKRHSPENPVVVEGGDFIWLREKFVNYFVLKADCEPLPFCPPKNIPDLSHMNSPYANPFSLDEESEEEKTYSVHEQDDGIIYAVCVTGTSSKDSLLSWVRLLQKTGNPILENVPVLFRFKTGDKTPVPFSEAVTTQKSESTG